MSILINSIPNCFPTSNALLAEFFWSDTPLFSEAGNVKAIIFLIGEFSFNEAFLLNLKQ